ncbi:uncharacterized protein KGF55_005253 [Candida pseudojiufengensis]|uniref:uncharacterized protein n=1 Tax=Candida pseudojiufengensis TaxID=497109 RepID=UPI0022249447|nr:uncharacterized protein KGF55_005253 [Candida pseudojiufengensis]KAI5959609.1 hypothetical protein KGF55_005253 [Candida pseudojiufengensis]
MSIDTPNGLNDQYSPIFDSESNLTLISLPLDIINLISNQLDVQNFIKLSTLNKTYRSFWFNKIFYKIKISWSHLINPDDNSKLIKTFKHTTTQIRIIDSYSNGDWNLDIFEDFFWNFSKLRKIIYNTKNSSGWLKYRSNDRITSLDLYYDPNQSRDIPLQDRYGHSRPIKKVFNIEHLSNFKMLNTLSLNCYELNWDSNSIVYPVLMLEKLALKDCDWSYPFQLSYFNYNNSLKDLKVELSQNFNHLLFSERYSDFLAFNDNNNNGFNLNTLENLTIKFDNSPISNDDPIPKRTLNDNILNKLLVSPDHLPNLRNLSLINWKLHCSQENFTNCIKNSKSSITKIYIQIINYRFISHMYYNPNSILLMKILFIQNQCKEENPNLDFKIKFIDGWNETQHV